MISKVNNFLFSLENQDGNFISNETIKGRKTILYFYPRDNTPTCTTEALNLEITLKILINLM